jgi:chitinase
MQQKIRFQIFSIILVLTLLLSYHNVFSQQSEKPMVVIAYYMGDANDIASYKTDQLTHIIFSFLHLKGNILALDNSVDSLTITKLVALKKTNPGIKIILSLGGWGGCKTCSEVFDTEIGREEFSQSVFQLFRAFKVDGIDLDWEYPAIASVPGHKYMPADKQNFTSLVKTLRNTVGPDYEISFAAGGFTDFLKNSVEWDKVMPLLDYVNMMTYDFVNGYSKRTGHLTSLYSTSEQDESVDYAVNYLDSIGVPLNKVVIGLAFYARLFSDVKPENNGLYQKGKFSGYVSYKDFDVTFGSDSGYSVYWDNTAKAPYAYNKSTYTFATFDNLQSASQKTKYAKDRKLAGVMFWELSNDKESGGMLDMIYDVSRK